MAIKRGTAGKNSLTGTSLADQIFGFGGADVLLSLGGNDLLDGGTGADRMTGGTSNDTYIVDNSGDRVIELASQGTDTVKSSITLTLGAHVEHLILTGSGNRNGTLSSSLNETGNSITGNSGVNVLTGGRGNDVLIGGRGSDTLRGGDGNDTLRPGAVSNVRDSINGGDGFDTVDYSDALSAVTVLLNPGGEISGGAALDVITNVESVTGSRFDDVLRASNTDFSLASGGGGNDLILAGPANYDRLRGDDGYDELSGFGGNDDFWLQYDRGMDTVVSFNSATDDDHVLIVKSEFGLASAAGAILLAGEFGTSSLGGLPSFSGQQRLIYHTVSRILWADKDGSGSAFSAVPIAYFEISSDAPTAADIFVL